MKTSLIIILCHFLSPSFSKLYDDFENENLRTNKKMLDNFINHSSIKSFDGLAKEAKIVGGVATIKDRYPYQVALFTDETQFCGGSLIASEWVLTAAHCAGYVTNIHIGRYDLGDDSEVYENIETEFEIPHPKFDLQTLDYDFMLVKLKTPSSYQPVLLYNGNEDFPDGLDFTVMGWGRTGSNRLPSDILLEVEVDYFPSSSCKRRYRRLGTNISERMMCASRSGKDACQGDSGGPIIYKGVDAFEDVQVGVVSWGIGCARRLLPGVYSRVSEALEFIDQYVSDRRIV